MIRKSKLWALGMAGLLASSLMMVGVVSGAEEVKKTDETAKEAIERLVAAGIIQGDSKGNLNLDDNINRASFVTIMVKAFGLSSNTTNTTTSSFSDVNSNDWYAGYVAAANKHIVANGFSMGTPGGTFNPDKQLSSIEALGFLLKFLGIEVEKGTAGSSWVQDIVNTAIKNGIITADQAKDFSSTTSAERGFVFQLTDNAFMNYKLENGKTIYSTFHSDTVSEEVYSEDGAGTAP